jgi:hypothetical protein
MMSWGARWRLKVQWACFGPLYPRADCQVTGFPVFVAGSVEGKAVEVGTAAMLGN